MGISVKNTKPLIKIKSWTETKPLWPDDLQSCPIVLGRLSLTHKLLMHYGNVDFENIYVRYKMERLPHKPNRWQFCIQNKILGL